MANSTCRSLNEILADKLTTLCDEKDWTQAQLAEKLHVSRQMAGNYMNGEVKNIPAQMVVSIAEVFGVSTDFLLTESKVRTPDKSIEAVCETTGLSEDAVYMLCRPEISGTAEYLLHDENNLEFFRYLRDYLETSLLSEKIAFALDAFSPKYKSLIGDKRPKGETVLEVENREVVEQILLNRLKVKLEGLKFNYYSWLVKHGEGIDPDEPAAH